MAQAIFLNGGIGTSGSLGNSLWLNENGFTERLSSYENCKNAKTKSPISLYTVRYMKVAAKSLRD
jgi:hypothetical protein